MLRLTILNQEKGSALILVIVMLVAVSALGVTMITLGKNQVEMSTNLKVHEIARLIATVVLSGSPN
jgi:Tfp pilus assembly protein PilX